MWADHTSIAVKKNNNGIVGNGIKCQWESLKLIPLSDNRIPSFPSISVVQSIFVRLKLYDRSFDFSSSE